MSTLAASPSHSGVAAEMLQGTGCTEIYEALEVCLADNDRNFSKCREQTLKFRECMDAFADKKLALAEARNRNADKGGQ